MIAYVKGKIVEIEKDSISLFFNSIAYKIFVLRKEKFILNEEVKLYIYDYLKDDRFILYGFRDYIEYQVFELLISVDGIGPKTASVVLSNIDIKTLIYLIKRKDASTLKKYPGINSKAEAIIYSLFNKINCIFEKNIFKYENVFEAMKTLGYKQSEISEVIYSLDDGLSDEEALKEAVRRIKHNV